MNILLVKPPSAPSLTGVTTIIRDQNLFGLFEPLELEILAGCVDGAEVKILDMRLDPDLEGCLNDFRPDLVGVTCWTTGVYWAKKIMATVKLFDNEATTVVGGQHATLSPSDFKEPYVDIIVLGPGEAAFKGIVEAKRKKKDLSKIDGIVYQKNNKFFNTGLKPQIKFPSVPEPRRDLTASYRKSYQAFGEGPYSLVEISRGCAYNCNFCGIWKSFDSGYFTKDPGDIADELEKIEEEYLYFCDPNTTHNSKQVKNLLDLIEKRGIKKKYIIQGRVSSIVKNPEVMDRWADLGLKYILIGFESFKEADLDDYEKRTTLEMNSKALDVLKRNNIISMAQFILHPEFGEDDFDNMLRYVLENDIIAPAFTSLTPLPGSDLYKEKSSIMTSRNYELFDFAHCLLPTKLPRKEFYRRYSDLFIQSYLPTRILKRLPLYAADLLLNHWKWKQRDITGVKEPWRSDIRNMGLVKGLGFAAMGLKLIPEIRNAYKDELVDYPPRI